jgi:ribose 5-phosphate isomerase B
MAGWRLIVGSDDAGYAYKQALLADLLADPAVSSVDDLGVSGSDDSSATYADIGLAAGEAIAAGRADRAVLVCGTGIGMAIAANKVRGVRATVAHDSFSVERSVLSNDCQVLALGQRVIGLELARRLTREWIAYTFDPSTPSSAKVAVISGYEASGEPSRPTM